MDFMEIKLYPLSRSFSKVFNREHMFIQFVLLAVLLYLLMDKHHS